MSRVLVFAELRFPLQIVHVDMSVRCLKRLVADMSVTYLNPKSYRYTRCKRENKRRHSRTCDARAA